VHSVEVLEEGDDRGIVVRRDGEGVSVNWYCGDARFFTADQAREAITLLESMKAHPDVWMHIPVAMLNARVVDDKLQINLDTGRTVDWRELRRTIMSILGGKDPGDMVSEVDGEPLESGAT
jgi:hypothetical protein